MNDPLGFDHKTPPPWIRLCIWSSAKASQRQCSHGMQIDFGMKKALGGLLLNINRSKHRLTPHNFNKKMYSQKRATFKLLYMYIYRYIRIYHKSIYIINKLKTFLYNLSKNNTNYPQSIDQTNNIHILFLSIDQLTKASTNKAPTKNITFRKKKSTI